MPAIRPLGYWLKTVDRLIDDQFGAVAEQVGLTRRQWQLLTAVQSGARSPADLDIAVAPFLDAGETAATHLAPLVEAGLVVRTADGFAVTASGRETATRVQSDAVRAIRERTMGGIDGDDYAHLLQTLEKIARNLGWEDE
jgi:hypothetical protein